MLARLTIRSLKTNTARFFQTHKLPELKYGYSGLEPVLVKEIMEVHHGKHHAAYVNNLNAALEKFDKALAENDLSGQISLQNAIQFNGGGHINHSLFWDNLAPVGSPETEFSGEIKDIIEGKWGSLDAFQKEFNVKTAAVQGSGWGWLGFDKVTKDVKIATTANQDLLQAATGLTPLLTVDVWEHAYWYQYKNLRPSFLNEVWQIINWQTVNTRLALAKK